MPRKRPSKVVMESTGSRPAKITSRHLDGWAGQIGNVNVDTPAIMTVGDLWQLLQLANRGLECAE